MAENAEGAVNTTATGNAGADTAEKQTAQQTQQTQTNTYSEEEFNRRVQSESDKKTAEYGKRLSEMQKELESLKTEKMNAEQRKQYEDDKKAKEMAEKDRLLTERENRLTAIDELTKAKLYDGGDKANAFIDIVIKGADATAIAENVKAVKAYIDEQVAKGVDETFKTNGRNPNGGSKGSGESKDKDNGIAAKLGEQAAERTKKSDEVLNHYFK